MNIFCLQPNEENRLVEKEVKRFSKDYTCQEVFYPLWFLEAEVAMNFFASRIKKARMNIGVDGLCGDVSFICNEIKTCELDVDPMQILPLNSQMDERGLEKMKASLLPFILPKTRSILVRPSINVLNSRIIYKQLYRLSSKDVEGHVIFIDKSNGKIATFKKGAS